MRFKSERLPDVDKRVSARGGYIEIWIVFIFFVTFITWAALNSLDIKMRVELHVSELECP